MSLYNMLFGRNPQTALLLAVIGFKENDVERFRDVHVENEGRIIAVYTRTGGGNRSAYPQVALYRSQLFERTEDDDFDSTYATFYFRTPDEFVEDVRGLGDILANGLRKEFAQHLAQTINREPTEDDMEAAAYDAERAELARLKHFKANGHTFVPMDDGAMRKALELAEANGGELRTCWGIMPLTLTVKQNFHPYPNAKRPEDAAHLVRVEVNYDYGWTVDEAYWHHCQERFAAAFPVTISKIAESVERHSKKRTA